MKFWMGIIRSRTRVEDRGQFALSHVVTGEMANCPQFPSLPQNSGAFGDFGFEFAVTGEAVFVGETEF